MFKTIAPLLAAAALLFTTSCETCGNPKHETGVQIKPNFGILFLEEHRDQKALVFNVDVDTGECTITRFRAWLVDTEDPCGADVEAMEPFLDRTPNSRGQLLFSEADNYEETLAAIDEDLVVLIKLTCEEQSGERELTFWGTVDEWGCAELHECR